MLQMTGKFSLVEVVGGDDMNEEQFEGDKLTFR